MMPPFPPFPGGTFTPQLYEYETWWFERQMADRDSLQEFHPHRSACRALCLKA